MNNGYRNKRIVEALDFIEEDLIAEVTEKYDVFDDEREYKIGKRAKRSLYMKLAALAACFLLITTLASGMPAILQTLGITIPSGNTTSEPDSSVIDDSELLKDVKICYTSEPVSLSEEEINGIVLAFLKLDNKHKEKEEYEVKCFGKANGVYAVNVIDGTAPEDNGTLLKICLKFDIYRDGQMFSVNDAFKNKIIDSETYLNFAESCFEYSNEKLNVLTPSQYLENKDTIIDYGFSHQITFEGAKEDIPYDIMRHIAYYETFNHSSLYGLNFPAYVIRCYYEKDGIYAYICDNSSNHGFFHNYYAITNINGYEFYGPGEGGRSLMIFKDGAFYYLHQAYAEKVIDDDYVKELYDIYMDSQWWGTVRNKDLKERCETFYSHSKPIILK